MLRSIQELLRKINSHLTERLTFIDFIAIIGILLIISALFIFITIKDLSVRKEIIYTESVQNPTKTRDTLPSNTALVFASKNGTTYFYSWCSGISRIKPENKITFNTEQEAQASGRKMSTTCK